MCAPEPHTLHAQRGLTLIELLVAIVVALLVGLAATGSALFFNASQRQGIAVGGATINMATTLAALKEDVAQAGLGFFGDTDFLCHRLNLSFGARDLSQDPFSPLQVSRDAKGNDQIDAVYASEVAGGANVMLRLDATPDAAELRSYLPVVEGQAVLLSPAPWAASAACTVRSVTEVSRSAEGQRITFAGNGMHNAVAFAAPVAYTADARVALLRSLAWNRYRLDGTDLLLERRASDASAIVLRNVMAFRAQYGLADSGETTVVAWQSPTAPWDVLTPANIERVRALRIGIVTRSAQREKRDSAGHCVASESMPVLWESTVSVPGTDWACYRYRVSTVVVPLRNFALGLRS
jgi:type IV pilus assembly protein PilW